MSIDVRCSAFTAPSRGLDRPLQRAQSLGPEVVQEPLADGEPFDTHSEQMTSARPRTGHQTSRTQDLPVMRHDLLQQPRLGSAIFTTQDAWVASCGRVAGT